MVPSSLRSAATFEFGEQAPIGVIVHWVELVLVTTAKAAGLSAVFSFPL